MERCPLRKKKRMMSIEMKQEIIDKHERGVRVSDLVKQYNRSSSTICTILKQKDAIKAIKPTKGVTILSKMRTDIHDEMERLLLLWIRDKELAGDTVTQSIVSEKALSIYKDLQHKVNFNFKWKCLRIVNSLSRSLTPPTSISLTPPPPRHAYTSVSCRRLPPW